MTEDLNYIDVFVTVKYLTTVDYSKHWRDQVAEICEWCLERDIRFSEPDIVGGCWWKIHRDDLALFLLRWHGETTLSALDYI